MTMTRVKILPGCDHFCDGVRLVPGMVVDMTEAAAAQYIAIGLAEAAPVIESAESAPAPEHAARTRKPQTRKAV